MPLLRIYPREALPLGARILRLGCRGRDVRELQRQLAMAGSGLVADGEFGYVTQQAVRSFQARFGLPCDGVAGSDTFAALRRVQDGEGLVTRRVRPGDDLPSIAESLGLLPDALRRRNGLRRREKPIPGRLILADVRAVFLIHGETHPPALHATAELGPTLELTPGGPVMTDNTAGCSFPLLHAPDATWRQLLGHPREWPELAGHLRRTARENGWIRYVLTIPDWFWGARHWLDFLAALTEREAKPPLLLVHWPEQGRPLPHLVSLARLPVNLLLDPGSLIFGHRTLHLLLRQVAAQYDPNRLLLWLRAGGSILSPRGFQGLSYPETRAQAAAARIRLVWDDEERIMRGYRRDKEGRWDIRLLEERGLRERTRLAHRHHCAGVVLAGLSGIPWPAPVPWPGEFVVADSF